MRAVVLAATALVALSALPAAAAPPLLGRDVFGAAGGLMSGRGLVLGMTIGETAVGLAVPPGGAFAEVAGFWGPGSVPVLDVGPPPVAAGAARAELTIRPNPSFGETALTWRLPAGVTDARARAVIFDTRGRRVRTLEAGAPAGNDGIVVTWDGRDASGHEAGPGIYFCRIEAGARSVTARFARLR